MNLVLLAQLLLGVINAHSDAGQPAPASATAALAKILGYYGQLQQVVAGLLPPSSLANVDHDLQTVLVALKADKIAVGGAQPFLVAIASVAASVHNLEAGQFAEAFAFIKNGREGVAGAMYKDGPAYKAITEGPEA